MGRRGPLRGERRRGQALTLDALVAATILVAAAIASLYLASLAAPPHASGLSPPDAVLARLLRDPGFVNALYARDLDSLSAYLASLGRPARLVAYDEDGEAVIELGPPIEGLAAHGYLTGYNGTLEVLRVCLVVG